MKGTIHNRDAFLANVAEKLGRQRRTERVRRPDYTFKPQWEVFKHHTLDELVQVLIKQCRQIETDAYYVSKEYLVKTIEQIIQNYGGGPVITWEDPRLDQWNLRQWIVQDLPNENIETHIWDPHLGEENIQIAEKANVGITFSDLTLAESGTVVLFSSEGKGRSVSLLPATYIAIIPKSTIVPRITQAAKIIHERIENGETIASCINFISGPSNSADIEMNLVVGVHGPIKASYIIVDD
ncbi:LutC/YkgG family protein [Bacillus alveayuensis]|jgi:L-lactate dehydrogenase complex protein LldG|uniref:LutC/YkgG family protein n=1 Tax=Aeribacillus alveayuensis TaxID=279215 RepID=UPI0005D0EEAD|nr:lactate utilization protein C [Bacillus alveayuensis]